MAKHTCANCGLRAKYDHAPKSLIGRLWRWHANWCPGWKKYMHALPDEERTRIARHYQMRKFV